MGMTKQQERIVDAANPIERTSEGRLCYQLFSQDGRLIDMACQDTPDMERFVRWVRQHDRYTLSEGAA